MGSFHPINPACASGRSGQLSDACSAQRKRQAVPPHKYGRMEMVPGKHIGSLCELVDLIGVIMMLPWDAFGGSILTESWW